MSIGTTFRIAVAAALLSSGVVVNGQIGAARTGEWREYGGDQGYTKYSPLDQINKSNVTQLRIAWRRPAIADEIRAQVPRLNLNTAFRATPIMVNGVLYSSNTIGLV